MCNQRSELKSSKPKSGAHVQISASQCLAPSAPGPPRVSRPLRPAAHERSVPSRAAGKDEPSPDTELIGARNGLRPRVLPGAVGAASGPSPTPGAKEPSRQWRLFPSPSTLRFRFESQQFQSFKSGECVVKGDQPQSRTLGKRSQIRVCPEVWRGPAQATEPPQLLVQAGWLGKALDFRQSQEFPASFPRGGRRQHLLTHYGSVGQMPEKCQLGHPAKGTGGSGLVLPIGPGSGMVDVGLDREGQPHVSVQKIGGVWQGLRLLRAGLVVLRSGWERPFFRGGG
jgi:hypothetical protein